MVDKEHIDPTPLMKDIASSVEYLDRILAQVKTDRKGHAELIEAKESILKNSQKMWQQIMELTKTEENEQGT